MSETASMAPPQTSKAAPGAPTRPSPGLDDLHRWEIVDGMRIDWDYPITMDDGLVLRADIFRPLTSSPCPVLLSMGPYGKGLAFQDGYASAWERLVSEHPEVVDGTSCKYANWEVVDPEKWVPEGYVCVRVDSRGAGRSPGYLFTMCERETKDLYNCITWAGAQPWSNGKVGLAGISYYAINQWLVAGLKPPYLAAICPWEGFGDHYRDVEYHGGILCTFTAVVYDKQILQLQHGLGERGPRSRVTGELVCGPETLSDEELRANRYDVRGHLYDHPLDDPDYYAQFRAKWDQIDVPLLSAANWGGQGVHPRGNFAGFVEAASRQKWLEVHGLEHWTHFYTDYGRKLQLRFFDHFLKGEDNGWDRQPPVQLQVRHVDRFVQRHETEWPIARTQWTRFHLDPSTMSLSSAPPSASATLDYEALGPGLTFLSAALEAETEITGPSAAKLWLSSRTQDADVFLVLRVFDPQGVEVVFQGALDPHTPIGNGWLRASHRKLDPARSRPYQPYHTHDEVLPLTPGEAVELDVEILPTSIVVPKGYRIGLTVLGRDYEWEGPEERLSNITVPMRGSGPMLHNDPVDRPAEVFHGVNTLHFGPDQPAFVLLPIVPARAAE